jgi:hypothetical protein
MEAETIMAVARSDVEVVGENMEEARVTMEVDNSRVAMVEVDRKVVMEEADRKVAMEEADSKAIRGGMVEGVSLPRHCPSSPKIIRIGHLLTLIR